MLTGSQPIRGEVCPLRGDMRSPRKQHGTIVAAAVWVLEKLLEVNSFKTEALLNFIVHFPPRTSAGTAFYKRSLLSESGSKALHIYLVQF